MCSVTNWFYCLPTGGSHRLADLHVQRSGVHPSRHSVWRTKGKRRKNIWHYLQIKMLWLSQRRNVSPWQSPAFPRPKLCGTSILIKFSSPPAAPPTMVGNFLLMKIFRHFPNRNIFNANRKVLCRRDHNCRWKWIHDNIGGWSGRKGKINLKGLDIYSFFIICYIVYFRAMVILRILFISMFETQKIFCCLLKWKLRLTGWMQIMASQT